MESTQFKPVMDKIRIPRRERGRPRRTSAGMSAGKTHNTCATRADLRRRGYVHLGTVTATVLFTWFRS
ncbi:hypothetical protein ACWDZ4_19545 [Streptomyces sp. NPDC003016]